MGASEIFYLPKFAHPKCLPGLGRVGCSCISIVCHQNEICFQQLSWCYWIHVSSVLLGAMERNRMQTNLHAIQCVELHWVSCATRAQGSQGGGNTRICFKALGMTCFSQSCELTLDSSIAVEFRNLTGCHDEIVSKDTLLGIIQRTFWWMLITTETGLQYHWFKTVELYLR